MCYQKENIFLWKKGQVPTSNLIEKTISNVWKWCNNYMILVNYMSVLYDVKAYIWRPAVWTGQ